jgi:signal peptide peptidase SppA
MPYDLAHIAARAFNTPLLIHPRKAEVIASVLAERIGVAPMIDLQAANAEREAGRHNMLDRFDGEPRGPKIKTRYGDEYIQTRYLYRDSVALITVEGTLVNRGAWIGADSGLTSYEGVTAQLASAAADRDVNTIIIDGDTPGGEASGAFEMGDFVAKVAKEKTVIAFVNGMAASAGYAMFSGASRIITIPSGWSGSIGVVMLHLDRSKQLERQGIKPTLIFAGDHKVDGNPFEPLPEEVRAEFQRELTGMYDMFVGLVARGRPNMSEAQVRATQARTFMGQDAVDVGLADEVATFSGDVLAEISRGSTGRLLSSSRGNSMKTYTEAEFNAAIDAARTTAHAGGVTEGKQAGFAEAKALAETTQAKAISDAVAGAVGTAQTAEQTRVAGILDHADAKGREATARQLAFKTRMSVDEAAAFLKEVPAASSEKTLKEQMAGQRQPDVGADGGTRAEDMSAFEKGAAEAAVLLGVKKK